MRTILPLVSLLLAFLAAFIFTRRLCDPRSQWHVLDLPNARSLHARPTPRSGGLGIVAGILLGAAVYAGGSPAIDLPFGVMAGGALVFAISFLDDRRGVNAALRLLAHALAASLAIADGLILPTLSLPGMVWTGSVAMAGVVSFLLLLWTINLYNFMDGMDGFAGGMAAIGFSAFAILGWQAGDMAFAHTSLIVAAASLGFLYFNFPPARIFMGDVGSASLGFLVGVFSIWGVQAQIFPLWVALLVFSPFFVDATVTLLRRLFRREKLWQAHKSHYYQRLVQLGWGHRKTTLAEYAAMIASGASAIWALRQETPWQWLVLAAWAVFYFGAMRWVERKMPLAAR